MNVEQPPLNWSIPYARIEGGPEMPIERHKPAEIITKLRQVEMIVGQGTPSLDAIREISITGQIYYRWRE